MNWLTIQPQEAAPDLIERIDKAAARLQLQCSKGQVFWAKSQDRLILVSKDTGNIATILDCQILRQSKVIDNPYAGLNETAEKAHRLADFLGNSVRSLEDEVDIPTLIRSSTQRANNRDDPEWNYHLQVARLLTELLKRRQIEEAAKESPEEPNED